MKVSYEKIPSELKSSCSFCLWRFEKGKGKIPYNVRTGEPARSNHPEDFTDFVTAMKACVLGKWDGIGFRVSEGIGAIDVDKCIREDGSLNDTAAEILKKFEGIYFEKSPSGTGLRGFFKITENFAYDKSRYYVNNRKLGLEVYLPGATNRFVTVTGDVYRAGGLDLGHEALQSVLDSFMKRKEKDSIGAEPASYLTDEQVVSYAGNASNGEKFKDLMAGRWHERYGSQSDADMALVSILAFWCGNVEEQIDRIFRTSGLMRDKWDRRTGASTYGQITIRNAILTNKNVYTRVRAEDEFKSLDMNFHTDPRYCSGDKGLGNLFADYYKPIARFNGDRGVWYVFNGKIWKPDPQGLAVAKLAKELTDKLMEFGMGISNEDARNRFLKKITKLQTLRNRMNMIKMRNQSIPFL